MNSVTLGSSDSEEMARSVGVSVDEELRILILEDVATDAELAERELASAGLTFDAKRVATRVFTIIIRSSTKFLIRPTGVKASTLCIKIVMFPAHVCSTNFITLLPNYSQLF